MEPSLQGTWALIREVDEGTREKELWSTCASVYCQNSMVAALFGIKVPRLERTIFWPALRLSRRVRPRMASVPRKTALLATMPFWAPPWSGLALEEARSAVEITDGSDSA